MKLASSTQKLFRIYGLREPGSDQFHYIGLTTASLEDRLADHLRKLHKTEKSRWIKRLRARGLKPEIVLIEEYFGWRKSAYTVEDKWIRHYLIQGHPILNSRPLAEGDK